jgi:hypothetical protein
VYNKAINKITFPFGTRRTMFFVPPSAQVVYVAADNDMPQQASVWYEYIITHENRDLQPDEVMKVWELGLFETGETYPNNAQQLGTLIDHGRCLHVIRLNVDVHA